MHPALPVDDVLPALRAALRDRTGAVLQAPPGAGKTTRVPLALLDEPWLAGRRIVVLEPRRLAARAAARRMAFLLGEDVGGTVGYRVRMDTRVGPRTRVEVVTEGVLTRMLQDDPALDGVGLVVFDEFHERSLNADLGLALVLQARRLLRPDLRVLVMSATLEGEAVAALIGEDDVVSAPPGAPPPPRAGEPAYGGEDDVVPHAPGAPRPRGRPAPVVTSRGRAWPVETRWLDRPLRGSVEPAVAAAVRRVLEEAGGDVLVFLPGAAEIRRVAARLEEAGLPPRVDVRPLHGSLPQDEQDRAIEPAPPGRRKVVLATSIAETSLTIEGVRAVVDAGLMRVPRFSPRTGMTRLETVPVTRASADQRRGRAGRLGPGLCLRLWTEPEERGLVPHATPEILEADLAPLALELAAWGAAHPRELRWLDPPPDAALAQARELLRQLGALDARGAITPHGRAMARLPVHPRLAHMLLKGKGMGLAALACDLAALLEERDIVRGHGGLPDADMRRRVEALRGSGAGGGHHPYAERGGVRRVRAVATQLRRALGVASTPDDPGRTGLLLAFAYPDRIARRRPGAPGRFLLRNGRGAALPPDQPLTSVPFLVAADLDDRGREGRIFRAAPLDPVDLETHFADAVEVDQTVEWDPDVGAVQARRRERLGAIVLRDVPVPEPDPEAVRAALLRAISREGLSALPWTPAARRLRERIAFLHALEPDTWPDVSDASLLDRLDAWLGPHLYGLRSRADLQRLDLARLLEALLPPLARARLDEWAPTHVQVPSGSRIPVDYSDPDAPVLAVRLQELFGWRETPRLAGGRVPLTLHLLSPAHRPVQVTRDLASFWQDAYFQVRKDLRGRYPKHHWPEDPLAAEAARGVGRRRR